MTDAIQWDNEYVDIGNLKPYERNPRTCTAKQFKILKDSIARLGFHTPIICTNDYRILGGHQRLRAMQELGTKVVRVSIANRELTDQEFKEVNLSSNLNAGAWDMEILANDFEVGELLELGFPEKLLADMKHDPNSGLTDEDAVPEKPANPVSVIGDIWICGNHRIMCGDSTNAFHVEQLLSGVKPHLMVTDPPYGVEYDAEWRKNKVHRADGSLVGARAVGKVLNDDRADWREAWSLFPGNIAYIWHAALHAAEVYESIQSCGFKVRAQIIWAKNQFAIGRGDYHWQHEPCWYAVKGTGFWASDRKQTTLWEINKPSKSETGHSTQKPIECMRKPIENNSNAGQSVYEPFSGSGTTIIACEQTDRHCYAMELNPAYVDVAVKRWQDFTGQDAIRESDSATFTTATNSMT